MNNDFFNFCIQQPKAGQRQLDKPTFYRDFILDPQLNGPATFGTQLPSMTRIGPDITFTRSSSATFINQEGNIQVVDNNVPRFEYEDHRTNLLSASNNFSSSTWVGYWTKSPDWKQDAIGPDGVANSAWSLPLSSAIYGPSSNTTGLIQESLRYLPLSIRPLSGIPVTTSIWAKADDTSFQYVSFGIDDTQSSTINVTTSWKRFSYTGISKSLPQDRGLQIYVLSGANTNPNSKLYLYGAQVEVGTTATPYISTGTGPRTVSRPKGLLIEEQRTNFVGEQNLFNWTQSYNTLSAGSGIAGLSSFIIGDEDDTQYGQVQYNTFPTALLSATTYCFSCYVKKNPNFNNTLPLLRVNFLPSGVAPLNFAGFFFNQATGQFVNGYTTTTSAISVQDFGTYFRTSFTFNTQSSATPTSINLIPSHGYLPASDTLSGTTVEVAGIQVEQGTFPTSYIPTVGSQVTRAADNAIVDGSNFVNFYNNKEGTIYSEFSRKGIKPVTGDSNSGNQTVFLSLRNTNNFNNAIVFESGIADPTTQRLNVDQNISNTITSNNKENTIYSLAGSYKDTRTFAQNGVIIGSNSGSVTTGINKMSIGSGIAGAALGQYLNGHIRKVGYWPKRLSNTTLRALTLSSLALGKYFAEDASLYTGTGPGVEITRTSSATYFASGGKLTTAYYNRPRFDYDPVTNVCKGLLIEEQRTNLLTYSSQFDNSPWTFSNVTVVSNAAIAPDKTVTADTLIENTSSGTHKLYRYRYETTDNPLAGKPVTFSVFAKAKERSRVQLYLSASDGSNSSSCQCTYNLSNGTAGTFQSAGIAGTGTTSIINAGNGWYRCILTFVPGAISTLTNYYFSIFLDNGTTSNYIGDGTSGLYLWGAQFEEGSFATSYIPTTNAQVTRTADTVQINSTNWQRIYNPEQGTFYTKVLPLSGSQAAAVVDVGDTYNSIHGIWKSGPGGDGSSGTSWNAFSYSDFLSANAQLTPLTANFVSTAGAANSGSGIAYTYGFNNFNASVNGSLSTIITQSTAVSAIPVMTGYNYLNGYVQTLEYYPIQLTNAQLTALTIQ